MGAKLGNLAKNEVENENNFQGERGGKQKHLFGCDFSFCFLISVFEGFFAYKFWKSR